jgi:hypothetical protein
MEEDRIERKNKLGATGNSTTCQKTAERVPRKMKEKSV